MLFGSQHFVLVFLPACLAGCFLLARHAGGDWPLRWVVACSLVFYGAWDPRFVPLLLGSILANYALGARLHALAEAGRAREVRFTLAAGIAGNLALLGWFKYAGMLARTFALPVPEVVLPLAISFFTFQQIMYLADSARREAPRGGLLPYMGFVSFFPHLIAGPIVRPREIMPQFTAARFGRFDADDLTAGITLFLLGLAKKLVLADSFAPFADAGFDAAARGAPLTFFEAWYALLAYGLQIYFDFSGYSDMAIGLARMLGVRFPLNFDSPYRSASIAEFWRRWHITLGAFLRDYVYIPLGGNRRGAWRRAGNLMATMLLGGLWHGAAWTFVLWGGLHGLFLMVHAGWTRLGRPVWRPLAQALTLMAVLLAWVPFRAQGMTATGDMLRGLAGLNGVALPQLLVTAWPALGAVAAPVPVLLHLGDARTLSFPEATICLALGWAIALFAPPVHRLTERAQAAALTAGFALSVQALFFSRAVAPFLYFRF
ncbi:MAG: MBOAT family protein [Proteobacteria bacterium]|nr:MBOAT family protein [Pseudomonadota bacterium]